MDLNKIIQLILIAMLLSGHCKISAQYNKENLQKVQSSYENVYMQCDRRVYVSGENIRYRAFLVNSLLKKPTNGSRFLYLELSDLTGNRAVQWRTNLKRGAASGTFPIPEGLKTGVYSLRAFTNFMRNGDPAYVLSNDLMIINILEGQPETIFIRNDSLDGVDFPGIESTGYKINIEKSLQGITATIFSVDPGTGINKQLQLIGVAKGNIILDTMINAVNKREVLIPLNKLNQGIISFVLLDDGGSKICERLYFYENGKNHLLQITGIKEQYLQSEEISFDLSIPGMEVSDSISLAVSVREVDPFNNLLEQPTIDLYLNLLSEVSDIPVNKVRINGLHSEKIQELLKMVHTDKYAWNYLNTSFLNECLFQKENHGLILNGDVTDSFGKPLADAHLLLCVRDSISPNPLYIKTDAEGRFYAVLDAFYDNKEILIQVIDNQYGPDLIWEIEQPNLPMPLLNTIPYNLKPDEITYIERSKNIHIVEEIYNLQEPTIMDDHLSTFRNSFITPDFVISPGDFIELVNFKEITDNILPTVRFITRNNQYNIEVFNKYLGNWSESRMILLNGVLFTDLSYISTLGSRDISRIEIYNSNIMCGEYTFPGLIALYTKDGKIPETYLKNYTYSFFNEVILNDVAEIIVTSAEGRTVKEFPDFRQSLYWNPEISFSGTEHVTVKFESSRLQGEFEVIIQGITSSGEAISETYNFKVE